jgi:2-oxoglutarate/2-oxoacid ferredoxin oxidoreductase subunit beta
VSLALGAEASFVARSVDSDRKHLQSVMRAAADHEGTAFIEIFQNCPIFNDDAFAPIKEPAAPGLIRLEHGSPVLYGPDKSMGLVYGAYGELVPVEAASVPESQLVVHDVTRQDPAYAFALSRLDSGDFAHTPIGVFRSVDRPSYDNLMAGQITTARAGGDGDLATLLAGNDTWEVR